MGEQKCFRPSVAPLHRLSVARAWVAMETRTLTRTWEARPAISPLAIPSSPAHRRRHRVRWSLRRVPPVLLPDEQVPELSGFSCGALVCVGCAQLREPGDALGLRT